MFNKYIKLSKKLYLDNKFFKIIALSTPILLFLVGLISHPKSILTNDWDYFLQLYESFRISVLEYGQFPWWNPWVAGGVPLYANPQFALFSIESASTLFFGSLYGLKIAIVIYNILGFWGMYLLCKKVSSNEVRSVLIAYVFVFSGFIVSHIVIGHLTFAMYYLVPWLFYYYLQRENIKYGYIYFVCFFIFFINSSPHYIVIQSILLIMALLIFDYLRTIFDKKTIPIKKDMIAYVLISVFSAHKLMMSYDYVMGFPKTSLNIENNAFNQSLSSLFQPYLINRPLSNFNLVHGWYEYNAYLSIFIFILLLILLYRQIKHRPERSKISNICLAVAIFFFTLSLGPFSSWSPSQLQSKIPILSSMTISSRWLGWSSFFILLSLVTSKSKFKYFNLLLFLAALELFLFNHMLFYRDYTKLLPPIKSVNFDIHTDFLPGDPNRFYKATLANLSEVHGYEPIIGYDYNTRPTKRVGSNLGGRLISQNAEIVLFTPNKIIIKRLGEGKILLNVNPSNYWRVNGKQLFRGYRAVETNELFEINDPSETIVCEIKPSYSLLIPEL